MSQPNARADAQQPTPRILVIEDDPAVAEVIVLLLEQEGYPVARAAHGAEALEIVARGMPDLILVDLRMPVMDGSTFVQELRRRYQAVPPIVLLTATVSPQDAAEGLEVAGHLGKPFDADDLLACVQRYTHTPPSSATHAA
ncbi:MAG: response regulator transcription factor [Chloroflexi bacterium]|nr:response regulator transcription factor [Chloroflexota bacterium]